MHQNPGNTDQAVFNGMKDSANLLQEMPGTEMNPILEPEPVTQVPDEVQAKADEASALIDAYKDILDALSEMSESENENTSNSCSDSTPYVLSPLAGI